MRLPILMTIVAIFLIGCRYNTFKEEASPPRDQMVVNGSIADVVEGFQRRELVVGGVVTTSDSCGNFYKELLIQDPSTGAVLSVRAGLYDLYALFPIGANVTIRLTELRVEWQEGLYTLELPTNLSIIASRMRVNEKEARVEPLVVDISNLETINAGRFIEVRNVYFAGGGMGTFADKAELVELPLDPTKPRTVSLYTSLYASFATQMLPRGVVTIRAVVLYRNGKAELKISDLADISVTDPSSLKFPTE